MLAQFSAQRGQMLAVSCFHRAKDMHRRDVRAGKGAIVHYLFDACAARGNLRGQTANPPGRSLMTATKLREPSIGNKAAFDDPAQDIGINISATKEEDDAFTGETTKIAGQACGQRSGGSPFNYALLQLYDAQNRKRDLFLADE